MQQSTDTPQGVVVSALYRFARFPDYETFRQPLLDLMLDKEVRGTLLLAAEGINGTIAGSREGIDAVVGWLRSDERFAGLETKESYVAENPFYRSKVKLKKRSSPWGSKTSTPTISSVPMWNRKIGMH